MKTTSLIIGLLLACCGSIHAQDKLWTLRECIDYAIEHNLNIQKTQLAAESQKIQYQTTQMQRLPYVSASASQNFGFGQTQDNTGVYQNINSQSTSAGISAGIVLFNGFQINNNIAAQKFQNMAAWENLNKAKEDLSLSITSKYLDVLYNKELYQIALEQESLGKAQVEEFSARYASGKIAAGDLYQMQAQYAQDQASSTESRQRMQLSLLELAQLLELEEWERFDIARPDSSDEELNTLLRLGDTQSIFEQAQQQKSEIKAAEYQIKGGEKSLQASIAERYPSLSLGASYSNSYYNYNNGVQADLETQLTTNGRTSIGLNLSIPIFNRMTTGNRIKQERLSLESAKLDLENTKKTLYKEIQQAWFNAQAAEEKYLASTESVKAGMEAFRFIEAKFNNDRATPFEYSEAKINLAKSQAEQVRAKYNYLFSIKILEFYQGVAL